MLFVWNASKYFDEIDRINPRYRHPILALSTEQIHFDPVCCSTIQKRKALLIVRTELPQDRHHSSFMAQKTQRLKPKATCNDNCFATSGEEEMRWLTSLHRLK
ncbi:hypothetical protein RvY_13381 [Ramazzottius varieornatus]|uniref:Uncharacterized protein n=1 Tax=Ramazzottius varieornatus TaxID=947166 RepID=A0A1D1VW77_RAMVA|nr:hypothetical protein RvY_13381 [Ramazzottius varieornatus]